MGGCLSSPTGHVDVGNKGLLKKPKSVIRKIRRIRGGGKQNRGVRNHSRSAQTAVASGPPSITGSAEEVWFEPVSLFTSDSSEEEDYHTVPDDTASFNGWEDSSSSKFPSSNKDQNHALSNATSVPENINLTHTSAARELSKDDEHKPEIAGKAENQVFPCGNTSLSSYKRRSSTPSPVSAGKKVALGHLYKTTEGQSNAALISPQLLQKRPVAGSLVPICPIGKEMFDSWSPIEPSTFRVRAMNYLRDKKKEHASNKAAYYPFGVDIYLSRRKINHIARLVELPTISSNPKLPALLVVNVQIPLYPPTIFQNVNDGEGMNVIMYFKLSERFEKELPLHFQESIRKLIDNEVEKIKGFHKDTIVPFRERLKILSRVANVDVLNLNAPQRKLMHAYNEKPILSRPQHEFYSGENYFEIDIDMHRFSYISRKGFDAFQDKLKICLLDIGLTIQGNKVDELPEQVLCCLRVNGIDHTNYPRLEPCEDIL